MNSAQGVALPVFFVVQYHEGMIQPMFASTERVTQVFGLRRVGAIYLFNINVQAEVIC